MFQPISKYKIKPAPGGRNPSIYSIRWSYDGKLLAAAIDDGRIRIYDGNNGRTKFSLIPNDGETNTSASDETHHPQHRNSHIFKTPINISEPSVAADLRVEELQNKGINHATIALRFSPSISQDADSNTEYSLLSSSSNGSLRFWKISQSSDGNRQLDESNFPQCTREIMLTNATVAFCVDYDSPGKRFAAGCKDAVVRVYDVETGALCSTLDGGSGTDFTGHTVAREMPSKEYALKVIHKTNSDLTAASLNKEAQSVTRHSNRIYSCRFTSGHTSHIDNLIISAGWDRTMQLWDLRAPGPPVKSYFGVYLAGDALDCVGTDIVTASFRPTSQVQIWDLRFGSEAKDVEAYNDGISHEFYTAQFSGNRDINPHFNTMQSDEHACFLVAGGTGSSSLKILDHRRQDEVAVVINDLTGGVVALDFCPRIFHEVQAEKSSQDSTEKPKSKYAHLAEKHAPGENLKKGGLNNGTRLAIACKDSSIRVIDICSVKGGGFAYEDEEEVEDGEENEYEEAHTIPLASPKRTGHNVAGPLEPAVALNVETVDSDDSQEGPSGFSPHRTIEGEDPNTDLSALHAMEAAGIVCDKNPSPLLQSASAPVL